ncbi:sensor histidine kinase KdpD [Sphingomonas sp. NFR15]|uniref:sensor histidine kinase n=1 Tax=Sphingomonas sp. NFR15 TaxID=1566282 RepID=UPI00088F9679|nr:HAMP domain-containing sensor histidine kinase [Sphingomonas sp. NFR15]SDA20450.1 Signal transduction histidine kinase [Sphingomonas sp. NFR15]
MNAHDPVPPLVRGLVDPDGRLVEADQRLEDLNARAGGAIGEPMAVPQLARLARLAQRLGILVSRGVVAADGADDLDLWVRAEPGAAGVSLAITGWRGRPAWTAPDASIEADHASLATDADWRWETDAALRLTFLTPDVGTRHGFDADSLLGQPLTALFVLGEDESGGFPILGGLAMRERFEDQPARLRATGEPLRLAAAPRSNMRGEFVGFIGAAAVDRPQAARTIDDAGGAFAARLDTALRAPLGRIIANADSINARSDGPLRQDYVDYAADIASAARHLIGLVDDLVDLQAIERPDFQVAIETIDLADLARRAAGLLAVRAADAKVRIDKPALGEALPARGEFRRVLQILVNLIGNAVRYSPEGGVIWVRAERDGAAAAIIVADQGKGIAEADQARIFEKFERVDPREPGGSGLGLYIARRLARAMDGEITLDSAPGHGARFVLTLPAA